MLKNERNLVGFDLDNTLCQTDIILREAILGNFAIDIHPIEKYTISIPGISQEEFKMFVRNTLSRCSEDILPYNDTIEILEKFYYNTNHPIIIITARHSALQYETHAWCKKWLTVPYKLYFAPANEKRNMMLYLGIKYYIDDHPETIIDIMNRSSINVFLMDKSYNKDCKLSKRSCRIRNLTEFYNIIF